MIRRALCWAVVGLLAFGVLGGVARGDEVSPMQKSVPINHTRAYTTHAPIRINSDAEFNTSFANRTIWGLEINGTGYGCCIYIGNCSQSFTVKDCYLYNASGKSDKYILNSNLCIYESSNGIVIKNTLSGNLFSYGIRLDHSSNIAVTSNICHKPGCGILLNHSTSNTLANNNCTENYFYSICLFDYSNSNDILNNVCSGNYRCGISLDKSNFNFILGNNCSYCSGIVLINSDNNSLMKNKCSFDAGINLYSSNTNSINENNCSDNPYHGIDLETSIFNTIYNNYITHNKQYGIYINKHSVQNNIHNNIFIANNGATSVYNISHIQGFDETETNFWNTTLGGNYWSDWTTPDNDSNGIVDFPYYLEGGKGAKDYYPLTTLPIPSTPSGGIDNLTLSIIIAAIIIIVVVSVAIYVWRKHKPALIEPAQPPQSPGPQ